METVLKSYKAEKQRTSTKKCSKRQFLAEKKVVTEKYFLCKLRDIKNYIQLMTDIGTFLVSVWETTQRMNTIFLCKDSVHIILSSVQTKDYTENKLFKQLFN